MVIIISRMFQYFRNKSSQSKLNVLKAWFNKTTNEHYKGNTNSLTCKYGE